MQRVGGIFWELQQDLPLGNVPGGRLTRRKGIDTS